MGKILTDFQKKVLKAIGESELSKYFIWSGGTALSYGYLQHRKSQDLDFLSKDLLPDEYLLSQVKIIAKSLKIKKIEEQKRFNRHEFWFKKDRKFLRIEFVFYPFPDIKKTVKLREFDIRTDSLEDILTNKAHTIFERAEPKDVFDFYCILQKKRIDFLKILKWVERKFGVEIDPVILTSKILEGVEKLAEIKPLLLKRAFYKPAKIKEYFEERAQDYLKRKVR
jgi:predicted nucleotidyltransferase component of viral defense system